jgi:hypothetical protein
MSRLLRDLNAFFKSIAAAASSRAAPMAGAWMTAPAGQESSGLSGNRRQVDQ